MSAARRFALVFILALTTVALSAASVMAQTNGGNPSGGTSLRQTLEEGSSPSPTTDPVSFDLSFDYAFPGWLSSYLVTRSYVRAATRPVSSLTWKAMVQRRVWGR